MVAGGFAVSGLFFVFQKATRSYDLQPPRCDHHSSTRVGCKDDNTNCSAHHIFARSLCTAGWWLALAKPHESPGKKVLWWFGIAVARLWEGSPTGFRDIIIPTESIRLIDIRQMTWSVSSIIAALWDLKVPDLPVESWLFCAVVLVALMIGIWLVARYVSSVTEETDPAEIDRQMLTAVTELNSRGELTPEEYRSIKSQLIHRLADSPSDSDSADSSSEGQPEKESQGLESELTDTSERKNGSDDTEPDETGASNDQQVVKDQNNE